MDTTLTVKEVSLCNTTRCPLLIFQRLASGEEVAIPLGVVEACLVGCLLHEDGIGVERCTALLAEALREADGTLVAVEIGRTGDGPWRAELVFRRDDGSTRRYRCRPADAATMAVGFRVPLTLKRVEEAPDISEDLDPPNLSRCLTGLSPKDFEGLGTEASGGPPPE
ncbi:MAG: bifunctional nuclease domain-containing protein [Nitrospinota bacterium]